MTHWRSQNTPVVEILNRPCPCRIVAFSVSSHPETTSITKCCNTPVPGTYYKEEERHEVYPKQLFVIQKGILATTVLNAYHQPRSAPIINIGKMSTTNFQLAAFFGPQPRDPPNGRTPSRPRPPKTVQPRDDGSHRTANACYGPPQKPKPEKPWPRDPGNGRQFALGPRSRR